MGVMGVKNLKSRQQVENTFQQLTVKGFIQNKPLRPLPLKIPTPWLLIPIKYFKLWKIILNVP